MAVGMVNGSVYMLVVVADRKRDEDVQVADETWKIQSRWIL